MKASELIQGRRSVRAYSDKPVEKEKLIKVLQTALRAPSWKNAQGYRVLVVEGDLRNRLSERFIAHALAGNKDNPDYPYQESYPNYIKKRMIELGGMYYGHLGVDRKDLEKRKELTLDNFRFFGAPTVLFFVMEKGMGYWPALDLGIFLGTLMVVLREEGLECIAQAALAAYPDLVRQELNLESRWQVAAGMSIGYGNMAHPQSSFISPRAEFSEMVSFY